MQLQVPLSRPSSFLSPWAPPPAMLLILSMKPPPLDWFSSFLSSSDLLPPLVMFLRISMIAECLSQCDDLRKSKRRRGQDQDVPFIAAGVLAPRD